ncbi:ChaN family lipoprotein [Pseudoduganella sp. LjRoot289]|uniref:ChaN family lipoprotein n=1 Tax=Pseudoduganella sp. LjRoot289 TaxID=3342314 RepID=UPI003ECEDC00
MNRSLPALLLLAAAIAGCAGSKNKSQPETVLVNPQVLLLGEVHDNAEGHKLRYRQLFQRVEAGWRPAIAMEQFDREHQALLNKAQRDCRDAKCLLLVMAGPHWDWDQYRPIIDLALRYELPLIAANLSRADASRVVRDGVASSFDEKTVAEYRLKEPLPADIVKTQQKEIVAGHCNMLSDMMVPGMVNAQVARDIWMAKLLRAQQPRDVVLIAGNGHVRKDYGVPRWLNAVEPRLTVRSIGYVEAAPEQGLYDASYTVAGKRRPDPCAGQKPKS